MERDGYLQRARRVFVEPGTLETEDGFRTTLGQLACTGLQWGGLLGLIGLFILIPVNVLLLGRPASWGYPSPMTPEAFVLWDEAVGSLLCAAAIGIGWARCRLSVARVAGFVIALALVCVSLVHDAYRGILTIEYVILVYLLTVAVIPYRPWQAFLLGGAITGLLAGIGAVSLPGAPTATSTFVPAGSLVRMGFVTVVLTGISALLYSTRYHQHRARRQAEQLHDQVAKLERAKSHFFADVAHEFRTPLTILLGGVREALDGRFGELAPELRGRLETMDTQTRRMRRLVNQLLELAQLDEGRMTLSLERHDLGALVEHLALPLPRVGRDGGNLVPARRAGGDARSMARWRPVRGHPRQPALECDQVHAGGGTIRVRVSRRHEHAEIAVRDTGPGLPEAVQARVFDRFESTLPTGTSTGGDPSERSDADQWFGMGIGLAHTKALVERHGGRLEVETEEGFGTEFTVQLPLGDAHVSDADIADQSEAGSPGDHPVDITPWKDAAPPSDPTDATAEEPARDEAAPQILVVDDEAEMREYLQSMLVDEYRVVAASDGDEALKRLREHHPDLVISDVGMPGRDGIELCRAIREDEQLKHVPVILLTARQDHEDRLSGLDAGADAYVSKPFDPAELQTRVENLIEIRRIVQDRIRLPEWMEPKEASVAPEDAQFLEALNETVDEHIDNSNFGVDWLADEMDLSTRHLRRRLKEVTRLSPAGFIRTRRLEHAAHLLSEGVDTISDVSAAVGYRDANYFSRLFRETFGCSPSEYADAEHHAPD